MPYSNIAPLPNPSPVYGRGAKSRTETLIRKQEDSTAYHNPRPQAGEGARQRGIGAMRVTKQGILISIAKYIYNNIEIYNS